MGQSIELSFFVFIRQKITQSKTFSYRLQLKSKTWLARIVLNIILDLNPNEKIYEDQSFKKKIGLAYLRHFTI